MKSRHPIRFALAYLGLAPLVLACAGTASGQTAPAAAASDVSVLDDIIVTAQRRPETAQSTPLAITALSGEALSNRNIVNVQDFNAIAPNVTFGELNGFARINIRGIGNQNYFTGGDPSVTMYVDNAVISQAAAQMSAFFDLERMEVLRGPQGTLYGRNATGGSVNLITRKPSDALEAYADLTVGNYDNVQLEAAVGGPIVGDTVKGRFSIFKQKRGGFGINEFTGKDINDVDRLYMRGQLQFESGMHNLLVSVQTGHEDDTNYQIKVFRQANPGAAGAPTGVLLGGTVARGFRNVNSEADLKNQRDTISGTLDYTATLSDALSLRSITNARNYKQDYQVDIDATQIRFANVEQIINAKQFSQELQGGYTSDKFNAVAGLYYFHEKTYGDNHLGPSRAPPIGPPGIFFTSLVGTVNDDAYGAFAQGTYKVLPNLGLTAGIRYSDEKRNGTGVFNGPTSITPPVSTPRHIQDSNTSIKLGADWNVTDKVLAYASYSQGFKSGVIIVGSSDPVAKPELVDAYEVGLKGDYLDNRLRVNLAGFFYDYQDLQISQLLVGASVPTVTNAATAKVKGVEAEVTAVFSDRLNASLKLGYLDATFDNFSSRNPRIAAPAVSPVINLSGNRLPYAPEWTSTLHGEFRVPMGALEENYTLTAMADVVYASHMDFSIFNEADLSQPSNTKVDLSLKLAAARDRWSVMVWGKNITDEDTFGNLTVGGGISSNRNIYGVLTPPRTYGVTLGVQY